jgi:hypothetical protein
MGGSDVSGGTHRLEAVPPATLGDSRARMCDSRPSRLERPDGDSSATDLDVCCDTSGFEGQRSEASVSPSSAVGASVQVDPVTGRDTGPSSPASTCQTAVRPRTTRSSVPAPVSSTVGPSADGSAGANNRIRRVLVACPRRGGARHRLRAVRRVASSLEAAVRFSWRVCGLGGGAGCCR